MSPANTSGLAQTVFMGTPAMAVPALRALLSVSQVRLVVTRPDRPRGRSATAQPPAVKSAAIEAGIAVAQPSDRHQLLHFLTELGPFDAGVVAAYGMLLPAAVLGLPSRGFLNVHYSLLPRWRGASPVVAAIAAGDEETGVTIMVMDEGLDTGPVVAAMPAVIGDDETGGALATRLAGLGAELLAGTLGSWMAGRVQAIPQVSAGATYAPIIRAADRRLDLSVPPEVFVRRVRALAPQPGATLSLDGIAHRVLAAEPVAVRLEPGELKLGNESLVVGSGGGGVRVLVIHPPGGRPLPTSEWLRGLRQPPSRAD